MRASRNVSPGSARFMFRMGYVKREIGLYVSYIAQSIGDTSALPFNGPGAQEGGIKKSPPSGGPESISEETWRRRCLV
ncbi:hypothetical protein QF002_000958 [Paraburkholderia youngii]